MPRRAIACILTAFVALVITVTSSGQDAGYIAGVVEDARSGEPLPEVTVILVGTLFVAVTDGDGSYAIESVPPGVYRVAASMPRYGEERREVMVSPGDSVTVHFRLRTPEIDVETIDAPAGHSFLYPVVTAQGSGQLALREMAGVDAARRGGYDYVPAVRGLMGPQIVALVDGVRFLAGSPNGFGSPVTMPEVTRMEVIRGPYALAWGPGMLRALRVTTHRQGPYGFTYGQTRTARVREVGAHASTHVGPVTAQLQGAWHIGRDYRDGRGRVTPADVQSISMRAHATHQWRPSERLVVQGGWGDRSRLDAAGGHATGGIWRSADVSSRYQRTWRYGVLRSIEMGMSWQRTSFALGGLDGNAEMLRARLATQLSSNSPWVWHVGVDLESTVDNAELRGLSDVRTTNAGAFVQVTRAAERLLLSATARADRLWARSPFQAADETIPSGAVMVSMRVSENWRVSAGLGTAARTATAYERFATQAPFYRAPFGNDLRGNAALVPERNTQADLWLTATYPKLHLQLSAFSSRLSDYITSPGIAASEQEDAAQFINGRAALHGVEAAARYALLGAYAAVHARASYVRGIRHGHRRLLYGIAPPRLATGIVLTVPANLLSIALTVRAAGAQTQATGQRAAGYAVLDTRLDIGLARNWTVALFLLNVTNRYYAHHLNTPRSDGLPSAEPNRLFYVRIGRGF